VYFAADRPYGLIEGTVLRAGAEARIPVTELNRTEPDWTGPNRTA